MKPLALICGLMLAMSSSLVCKGADTKQPTKNPPEPFILVKQHRSGPTSRPKSPDRQRVTVMYDGESMDLNFVIPEGTATLTVTDSSLQSGVYAIDTSGLEASVEIGTLTGTVTVELETEKGNSYCGEFEY